MVSTFTAVPKWRPAAWARLRKVSAAPAGRAMASVTANTAVVARRRGPISVAVERSGPGPLGDEAGNRRRQGRPQPRLARPAFEPGFALDAAQSRGRCVGAVPQCVVQRDEAIA